MPPRVAEPEIIPPGQPDPRPAGTLDDETLSFLASLLDDAFRVPGTNIRFGLDPLLGLIPGLGDLLTSAASFLIILAGWQRRLPKVTVARMMANVAIDTLLGSVPVFGDLFDVAWKSNRKNLTLLQRSSPQSSGSQTWRDWLFLLALVLMISLLIAIPIAMLAVVIHFMRR